MVLNTTTGAKEYDRSRPGHTLNTSAVVEEDLVYVDEAPEIIAVLPATGWAALIGDEAVPMPMWVVLDDGTAYGVVVGADGLLDPLDNVEKHLHFTGYKQANNR
jgi:hypothetical protein